MNTKGVEEQKDGILHASKKIHASQKDRIVS